MSEPSLRQEKQIIAVICAITILLLIPKATSELWMDELLTVSLFTQLPSLGDVFSTYPIANNHILFSACGWIWLKIVGSAAFANGLLLRLPSVAAVALGVLVIAGGMRRAIGPGRALMAAAILGINPITQSLGWQFRGYGLSLFLGSLAVVGVIAILQNETRVFGRWAALPALVLLPIAVPSNLLLNAAIVLFVLWEWQRRRWEKDLLPDVAAVLVAAGAGVVQYLAIWDQFLQVVKQTAGWSSGGLVAGHWLLALTLALAPACIAFLPAFRKRQTAPVAKLEVGIAGAKRLALIALGISIIFALIKAPFPRTLIVFVPALIVGFAACLPSYTAKALLRPLGLLVVVGCALALGLTQLNERDRANGVRRQNLLTQSYTGSRDWAELTRELTGHPLVGEGAPVMVPFYDILTAQWYWPLPTGDPPVFCPIATGAYACPISPSVMQQRPFVIISPPGDGHLAACSRYVGCPLETQLLMQVGNLRVLGARAVPVPTRISENIGK